jgi:hypothetical protein
MPGAPRHAKGLSYYQRTEWLVFGCKNAYYQQKMDELTADNKSYLRILLAHTDPLILCESHVS